MHSSLLDVTVLGDTISCCVSSEGRIKSRPFFNLILVILFLCVIFLLLRLAVFFQEIVMAIALTKEDKAFLQRSIQTEIARVRRSVNAERNLAIKEILQAEIVSLQALEGRISQEVVK